MGTRGKRRHKRENLSLYSFGTTDVGGRSCWLWLSRHIIEILDRKAWSRDGEGGDCLIKERKHSLTAMTCPRIWTGQCWFILLASFHPLLSTICEASLFCVNWVGAWKMKKWGICREGGTCNGQHKNPPSSQTFSKAHYTNECLACMKFSGAKAVISHSLGNMMWHIIYGTERCSQKWWERL